METYTYDGKEISLVNAFGNLFPVNEDLRLFCLSLLNWLVVFVLLNANSK